MRHSVRCTELIARVCVFCFLSQDCWASLAPWPRQRARPDTPVRRDLPPAVEQQPDPRSTRPPFRTPTASPWPNRSSTASYNTTAALTIVPALASTWKGVARRTWCGRSTLRKGVKFHNGRELVADDVVYSFTRILDPNTTPRAPRCSRKSKVRGTSSRAKPKRSPASASSTAHTLQIDLLEATGPFVASLAIGYAKIVPREVVQALGAEFGNRPVGTGPFKFTGWKKDEMIQLEANPDYFAGRPFLDRLGIPIYSRDRTIDQMYASFRTARPRGHPGSDARTSGQAQEYQRSQFVSRPILGVRFFGFNTTKDRLANRHGAPSL